MKSVQQLLAAITETPYCYHYFLQNYWVHPPSVSINDNDHVYVPLSSIHIKRYSRAELLSLVSIRFEKSI